MQNAGLRIHWLTDTSTVVALAVGRPGHFPDGGEMVSISVSMSLMNLALFSPLERSIFAESPWKIFIFTSSSPRPLF